MDLRTHSHDFIIEFINGFRECPCLWQTKSSEYKNKGNRLAAYNKLVDIAKKYEPNSDVAGIKKKNQSLRASHRKERNKVIASMRTGSGVEDLYQPKLWYYQELEFLNDPVESTASMSTLESENDENRSQLSTQDSLDNVSSPPTSSVNSLPELPSQTPSPPPELPPFTRKRKDDTSNQMFHLITQRLSQQDDDFDIFGKNVASKLRTMTTEQKILAEKLINDVIFNGQMERLSINSEINVGSGNNRSSTSMSTVTTQPQFQVLTDTDNRQFYTPAPTPLNIRSSTSTPTVTIQPQFQVLTDTDNQHFQTENSNTLSYYVSQFSG